MNYRYIFNIIGKILIILSILLILPVIVSIYYKENIFPFIYTMLITLIIGLLCISIKVNRYDYYRKDGIIITTLSWIIISILGSLPFIISESIPNVVDAIFETASGFTTTGASILKNIEILPKGILFWRSFTHWIGGMGILVFVLAILPIANNNSMHVAKAEMPGPFKDKISPKLNNTAKWLYIMYIVLTLLEILILYLNKMPLFDSVLTSFGTAGTGGFGIKNTSIAFYNSKSIEYIISVFMLLFGINFNVYFYILLRKFKTAFKNQEMRFYLLIVLISTLLITINIYPSAKNFEESFRLSFFQVSSIITTTGFSTTNFDLWPQFSKTILFILMIIGACGGSTGGGIKVSRIVIIFKKIYYDGIRLIHPNITKKIKFENNTLSDTTVNNIGFFFILYFVLLFLLISIVSLNNLDFETTISSVVSCMSNIGPGFNLVGPAANFSIFNNLSKITLTIAMILGRLELYPVLLLLFPKSFISKK